MFVDPGLGKGRTLLLADLYRFRRIVGVEPPADVSRENQRNSFSRMTCLDTEVVAGNVLGDLPPENEDLFVDMFNPFSARLDSSLNASTGSPLRRG